MEEMVQSAETAEVLNNAEQEQVKSERGKEIDGERYILARGNSWVLKTPYKISKIIKLYSIKIIISTDITFSLWPTDVSDKVLERHQWDLLDEDIKNNYFWYEVGSNVLHICEYYYSEGQFDLVYYVEYIPVLNPKIKVESEEYVKIINQTHSQLTPDSHFRFISNYLNASNKSTISVTKMYTNYYEFANKLGDLIIKDGNKYVISSINYINIAIDFIGSYAQIAGVFGGGVSNPALAYACVANPNYEEE